MQRITTTRHCIAHTKFSYTHNGKQQVSSVLPSPRPGADFPPSSAGLLQACNRGPPIFRSNQHHYN